MRVKLKKLLLDILQIGLIFPFIVHLSVPTARAAEASLNVNLVGYVAGGNPQDVFVKDNIAYVAAEGMLSIIDVTQKDNPQQISYIGTPGNAQGVYVSGNYAYVADGSYGLKIIDISNPYLPVEKGTRDTPGSAQAVFVSGIYAYVADGSGGLCVINISNENNPVIAGTCTTPGDAYDVYISSNFAYVTDHESHSEDLRVIDISNPADPREVGRCSTPRYAYGVHVSSNYAYVADHIDGWRIIDISSSTAPTEIMNYDQGIMNYPYDVYVSSNYLYLADQGGGLKIIDISSPTAPIEMGYENTPGRHSYGVYVKDDYAYLADDTGGLRIINISNKNNPQEVGFYDTPGTACSISVDGNYAYVGESDTGTGLHIINILNPNAPYKEAFHSMTDSVHDIYVQNGYAYVANGFFGLKIIDINTPTSPLEIATYNTSGDAVGVQVSGNYAYVADGSDGLHSIDISNPNQLAYKDTFLPGREVFDLFISSNYAYVAGRNWSYDGELYIIDISSPSSLSLAGSFSDPAYDRTYTGIAVSGDYAYVAAGYDGLLAVNISSPTAAFLVDTYPTGYARDVYIEGNYALVADRYNGVRILDISDPANLNEVAFHEIAGHNTEDVFVINDRAYVVDSNSGLWILQPTMLIPVLNQPPYIPQAPTGPDNGSVGIAYNFSAVTTDPEGDQIQYEFDWGDGTPRSASTFVNSGVQVTLSHSYTAVNAYSIQVRAIDAQNASGWSAVHDFTVGSINQSPPFTPSPPSGPAEGLIGTPYDFTASTTDPDQDQVKYRFDWGDGSISSYTYLVNSGNSATLSHIYTSSNTYHVRVQAMDSKNAFSAWSSTSTIVIKALKPDISLSPLHIVSISPQKNAMGADPVSTVQIKFNNPMNIQSVSQSVDLFAVRDNYGRTINSQHRYLSSWNNNTLIITTPLKHNHTYQVIVPKNIQDINLNTLNQEERWYFTTFLNRAEPNIILPSPYDVIAFNDNKTSVDIEAFALSRNGYVVISMNPLQQPDKIVPSLIQEANAKLKNISLNSIDNTIREFNFYDTNNTRTFDPFAGRVTITIPYPDADNDGIVDNTIPPVKEEYLSIYRLDEQQKIWVQMSGATVDTANKTVHADVNSFSVYTIMAARLLSSDTSESYCYPVPYAPNDKNIATGTLQSGITFTNLPAEVKIKIYTISGELVKTIEHTSGAPQLNWDVTGDGGQTIASGVYIYQIKTDSDEKFGKLMIIR